MGLIKSLSIHPYRKNIWKEWLERMIDSEIFVNPQQTSFSLLQSVSILSSQNANSTRREVLFHSTPVLIQNNDLKLHRQWTVLALRTHLHPALWVRSASHLIFDLHHCGQVAIIIMMSLLVVPAFTNYSCPAAPSLLCHRAGNSIFEVFIIFEIFQGANSKSRLSIVSEDTQISSDDLIFGNIYTYKATSTSWSALTTSG